MDLVYFGSGDFGLPTLQALVQQHAVRAIVTQPDKPAGRGGRLTPTPVGQWAMDHAPHIPLLRPDNVNHEALRIRDLPTLAWVVIAYGQKLGRSLLHERFAINLHASLLPRWRGAAPYQWAVLAGDRTSGNSVITLADRMDAGLVLAQSTRDVGPTMTAGELHDALSSDGPALVLTVLERLASNTLAPVVQDESLVTHARKLTRDDRAIDLELPADACRARVNGLSPWPGAAVELAGHTLKLLRAGPGDANTAHRDAPAGTITDAQRGLVVGGDGNTWRLLRVQPPGGREMDWTAYANGRQIIQGQRLQRASPAQTP